MRLDDDIVHRILLAVEFKERHALARVSKQFSSILSSRADAWENDAEFIVANTNTFELCVRWMCTRWFRRLCIRIQYPWQLYRADEDLEACDTFFKFLIAFAPRLRHLDISASYHIRLKYAPLLNTCHSLRSLKMYVFAVHRDLDFNNMSSLETLRIESHAPIRVATKCTLRSLTSLEMKSRTGTSENMTLPSLEKVSFDGAHWAHLPAMLGDVTTLTSLSLQRCNLIDIPEYVSRLTSLKHLRASRNSLTSIENLPPNITMLDVSHNMCVEFATLHPHIEILDISCNPCIARLEKLNLPNLKSVSCSAIPTQTFLSRSKHLKAIHIHEACRGYHAGVSRIPIDPIDRGVTPRGPTTTATRLFLDPEIYDTRDSSAELVAFLHANPHVRVFKSSS